VSFDEALAALLPFIGSDVAVTVTSSELDPTLIAYLMGKLDHGSSTTFRELHSADEAMTLQVGDEPGTAFFVHKERYEDAALSAEGVLKITTRDAVFRIWNPTD
jgi:hypothetical protein